MSHVAAKQSESWGKKLGAMTPYDEKEFKKTVEATTISLYSDLLNVESLNLVKAPVNKQYKATSKGALMIHS